MTTDLAFHHAEALYDIATGPSLNKETTVDSLRQYVRQVIDVERLSSNPAGKVAGYTAQPDAKVALVNENKALEETILRGLDKLQTGDVDKRWLAIARTSFEIAFMQLNQTVFQPQRIRLPEDELNPPDPNNTLGHDLEGIGTPEPFIADGKRVVKL